MSSIPSIKQAEQAEKLKGLTEFTIICHSCRTPLWLVTNMIRYGTRTGANYKAFPGVPEYNDIWPKNNEVKNENLLCVKCGEPWIQAVQAKDKIFAIPTILEFE